MGENIVKSSAEGSKITINKDYCKGCEICVESCPVDVFEMSEDITKNGYHYSEPNKPSKCINCKKCELMCPEFAIEVLNDND